VLPNDCFESRKTYRSSCLGAFLPRHSAHCHSTVRFGPLGVPPHVTVSYSETDCLTQTGNSSERCFIILSVVPGLDPGLRVVTLTGVFRASSQTISDEYLFISPG
jgi:hypothetical protein